MKPHPRIRKTVKWGGAAISLLLLALWVSSGFWWWKGIRWPGIRVEVTGGEVVITRYDTGPIAGEPFAMIPGKPEATMISRPFTLTLWFWHRDLGGIIRFVGVPLWPAAAASMLVTGAVWRLDTLARRRARANLCPKCHYDRTGLAPQAPCPECGTPPTDNLPT